MKISIVIPVLNEQDSLGELADRIFSVAQEHSYECQIVFVDDGSTDQSWKKIRELAEKHASISGIRFRRNFGKAAALSAGMEAVQSEWVITMDADLQDDPREIPHLLAKMEEGFDVVSGWKKTRHDPWHKVWPSRLFNWMVSSATGVRLHDHNCGLKAYRREIFDEVKLYGEMHRFIPVLAASRGWRVSEIPVEHHPRMHGVSKYGFTRFFKGFLDLATVYFLTGYRQRPQHLLGTLGLLSLAFGLLTLTGLTVAWGASRMFLPEADHLHLHERALFYYAMLGLLLGVQLLSIGFLAELIIASHRPAHPNYSLSEVVGMSKRPESHPT